jgi:hypothetical protein
MLPNFLIIGAAKAGTTSLYHYVRSHPQAFMPERKELSFFCEEFNWKRGVDWYERHFEGAGPAVGVGEASPRYTVYPVYRGVPARIAGLLPDVRLVYLVREPIKRMQSHYLDRVIHGLESQPIEQALLGNTFYLSSSSYALQLEQYLGYFPRDRILVILSEDLQRNRQEALSRVFRFLGIDPDWRTDVFDEEFLQTNARRVPRRVFRRIWFSPVTRAVSPLLPRVVKDRFRSATSSAIDTEVARLSPSLRDHLEDLLRDDVRALGRFLHDEEFDGWGIA